MEKTKVRHPKFGHVIFTGLTNRQKQILEAYDDICKAVDENPNDANLGESVRKTIKNATYGKKKKEAG